MEILATVEYTEFHILFSIIFFLITMLLIIGVVTNINDMFKYGNWDIGGILSLLFFIGVTLLFVFVTYNTVNGETPTEYKAKVTDFNEVYNSGYKITGQEGSIYILEKVE